MDKRVLSVALEFCGSLFGFVRPYSRWYAYWSGITLLLATAFNQLVHHVLVVAGGAARVGPEIWTALKDASALCNMSGNVKNDIPR